MVSAIFKSYGLENGGFFKSVSRVCKKSPALLPSFFLWCGKQDWILAARRRSVSAVLKPHRGLIHCGFFKSVSRFTKKKLSAFAELFSLVRETGLDSRGSSPLGQRRSQAPPGLDSLRLLQVPFALMILGKQKKLSILSKALC